MMDIRIISVILILLTSNTPQYVIADDDECKHDRDTFRCVEYLKNYDGDTITFNIPNIHPLLGEKISIRVNGIDTPEIRTKNRCEKEKALKAKRIVRSILKEAQRINLHNIKRGKYFRIVADVMADNLSIEKILLKKGLAYQYGGGTKKKTDWCNFL